MNKISAVRFRAIVAKQMPDPSAAHAFLDSYASKLSADANHRDAFVLATMEAAHYKLVIGDTQGCKDSINASEKILDSLNNVPSIINATYYRVSADYFKIILSYQQYYHNALLFLSSISISDLPKDAAQTRAYDLALSALLAEELYNFGEIVCQINIANASHLGLLVLLS